MRLTSGPSGINEVAHRHKLMGLQSCTTRRGPHATRVFSEGSGKLMSRAAGLTQPFAGASVLEQTEQSLTQEAEAARSTISSFHLPAWRGVGVNNIRTSITNTVDGVIHQVQALPEQITYTLEHPQQQGSLLLEKFLSSGSSAWSAAVSPFKVLSDTNWLLNILFFASISLLVGAIVVKAPKN
mmetsp:Transcript_12311/g.21783  ORF Transcript_12311/g.21783 Transcript_12311/m.21783 type:complete len:183 (-) Transcript_12311:512-1060(-)